jgi:hypothetical protein
MGKRRGAYRVLVWKLKRSRTLGKPGVDKRIILKWSSGKWNGGMDWVGLAQNRDRYQAFVNFLTS